MLQDEGQSEGCLKFVKSLVGLWVPLQVSGSLFEQGCEGVAMELKALINLL